MSTDTPRPSIDQAVDAIEKIARDAYHGHHDIFNAWWRNNKIEDRAKAILREYAQKENQELIKLQ